MMNKNNKTTIKMKQRPHSYQIQIFQSLFYD